VKEKPLEFELRTKSDYDEHIEGLWLSEGTIRQITLSLLYAHKKVLAEILLEYLYTTRRGTEQWIITELSRRKTKINFRMRKLRKLNISPSESSLA
jgi:DICT domain-containing protein